MSEGESLFKMLSKLHYFVNTLKVLGKCILECLENGFCDCEIQFVSRKISPLGAKRKRIAKALPKGGSGILLAFKINIGE